MSFPKRASAESAIHVGNQFISNRESTRRIESRRQRCLWSHIWFLGYCPRLIHETAPFGAKQIPGLWSALIGNRVRGVIFVEEIMKKRLRHRVRVIGILCAFAVAIGPTSFIMTAGRNEARVTQSNSQRAIARTERSWSSCLVFRLGRAPPGFLAAFVLASKSHSEGWISLRLNIARVRRVTSSLA